MCVSDACACVGNGGRGGEEKEELSAFTPKCTYIFQLFISDINRPTHTITTTVQFILPCIDTALLDAEPRVIARVLACLVTLIHLGLLGTLEQST